MSVQATNELYQVQRLNLALGLRKSIGNSNLNVRKSYKSGSQIHCFNELKRSKRPVQTENVFVNFLPPRSFSSMQLAYIWDSIHCGCFAAR